MIDVEHLEEYDFSDERSDYKASLVELLEKLHDAIYEADGVGDDRGMARLEEMAELVEKMVLVEQNISSEDD